MPIKVLLNEGRELRLRMSGEDHTSLQLFRSRLNSSKDVEYSNYFQQHPTWMNPNYTSELSRERAPRRYSRVYVQTSRRICRNSNCDGGGGLSFSSIEEQLGLTGWSSDGDGIGGLLKIRVEDFRVDEIACIPALDPKGRFTVARVSLNNWETNRFLGALPRHAALVEEEYSLPG